MCPICETNVEVEGQFCQLACWDHFHAVTDATVYVTTKWLDITQQPWYHDHIKG